MCLRLRRLDTPFAGRPTARLAGRGRYGRQARAGARPVLAGSGMARPRAAAAAR